MRVEDCNLVYDSEHPLCSMEVVPSQGVLFAFITVLDIGMSDRPLKKPDTRRYWGRFSWEDQEGSILKIMKTGGKWPQLKGRIKQ